MLYPRQNGSGIEKSPDHLHYAKGCGLARLALPKALDTNETKSRQPIQRGSSVEYNKLALDPPLDPVDAKHSYKPFLEAGTLE